MILSYFLGANSKDGFCSLYSDFCSGEGDFLHIIKGGPGTGKSAFMRKIGAEAERRGMDVEYVLCSGDPDSLDGVYIPTLRQGWVDGTAPHVSEPRCFGVNSDYVNLGQFCRLPLNAADGAEALRLSREYKAMYARAYSYLRAASELKHGYLPKCGEKEIMLAAKKRACSPVRRCAKKIGYSSRVQKRFISAISCKGILQLNSEFEKLCKLIYQLDDGMGLASAALKAAADEAMRSGMQVILCPSPLCPEELEAVLLPEASLALVKGCHDIGGAKHIRLDTLVPAQVQKSLRPELRAGRRLEQECMAAAIDKLAAAKSLHDKLEAVYRPYMDFGSLSEYTEEELEKIFR